MKTLILILVLSTQAHSKCLMMTPWKDIDRASAKEIEIAICADIKVDCSIELSCIREEWARALVDRKIIYYLHRDGRWIIIAKGPRFDIETWEKIGIPLGIR